MAQRRSSVPSAPDSAGPGVQRLGEPLYAIPFDDEGRDIRYFGSDEDADAAVTDAMIQQVLDDARSWIDPEFDWDEFDAEMHRIGHSTPPSPPIKLDFEE